MSKVLSSILTITALAAGTAHATPIRLDGSETNLQQIANNLTVGGSSSIEVVNDQYALDEVWQVPSAFGSMSAATGMIAIELAGYAGSNRFGLYDINDASNRLQLFSGADSAGATTNFSIDSTGQVFRNSAASGIVFSSSLFGFYLDTPVGTWFSQSNLNSDQGDHMVAYQGEGGTLQTMYGTGHWGPNIFMLGWEDLSSSHWDQDYNDMVVLVKDVAGVSVPEPATLGLLGLGLAGIGVFGRRKAKNEGFRRAA